MASTSRLRTAHRSSTLSQPCDGYLQKGPGSPVDLGDVFSRKRTSYSINALKIRYQAVVFTKSFWLLELHLCFRIDSRARYNSEVIPRALTLTYVG